MKDSEIIYQVYARLKSVLHQPDFRIYLFGSRARGQATEYSDFDFCIVGPRKVSPEEWIQVDRAMESLDSLLKIDLIDFEAIDAATQLLIQKGWKEVRDGKI